MRAASNGRTPDPSLTRDHARQLVEMYYDVQKFRIRAGALLRAGAGPKKFLPWLHDHCMQMERNLQFHLGQVAAQSEAGRWLMRQYGVGPVLAAGLLAHLDIEHAHAPSSFWRFAGLDPTLEWHRGQRRPYNARLRTLCWKIGTSFMRFSGREGCFYGQLYRQRKEWETERDEAGANAEYCRRMLEQRSFRPDSVTAACYRRGHLPRAQLDARARRWVVKVFLAHLFEVMWRERYPDREPPAPYVFEHMGHVHRIDRPD